MIDASEFPFEQNVINTRKVVEEARRRGVSVEGEYGRLQGIEDDVESEKTVYADPLFVPAFFEVSGADALAIAYGTSHGANKGKTSELKTSIVRDSHENMRKRELNLTHFLVGHGSSTVPYDLVEEINKYGGNLENTSGVQMDKIHEGIRYGLRKINIDTDLRLGITAECRKYFAENAGVEENSWALNSMKGILDSQEDVIDPREYLISLRNTSPKMLRKDYRELGDKNYSELMGQIKDRVAKHVEFLARKFGSAGLAHNVDRSLTLEKMAERYS